ncbi:MAG: aerobactin siderophore biosynthesis protein IucA [Moritella sp.]|uniref:GNAT family N-acetyltransferase n=1 Tax=unclassified Moritella TaxID=2637987 RepID=UPI000156848D|nr:MULTISPECIES: GNAT family N-acetyltransferase [unclassified Moritella]EDM68063.1 aerobactin siderophore biosynthesis protein IucA [Moritella sp. PE36]MBL1417448.1 GNAT family N-acetyltransferase [Moritella sp.]PHR88583.1 MAG: aerobactin siderophore biosynthesis protein IucA [Moritella sp.]
MQYSYAEKLSLDAFLNALLNEWQGYATTQHEICIDMAEGQIVLPLLQYSPVQRFQFNYPVKFRDLQGESDIAYADVIELICKHHEITGDFSQTQLTGFKQQVFASQAHMENVLAERLAPVGIDGFIQAEQSLIGGHNLHPAGKSHQGWTAAESKLYSPDYANSFSLQWYFVAPTLLAGNSHGESISALLLQTYQDTFNTTTFPDTIPDGYLAFPVHPHQAKVLRENTSIQQYFADGLIIEFTDSKQGRAWHPTSSTRALWQQDSRWMLKFSLAVKLTNSVRYLSVKELERGVLFKQVSEEVAGAELWQRFPRFSVLQEPAWCGLNDLAGESIVDSLFCWRENPFPTGKEPSMVLATLTQTKADGSNFIQDLIMQFAEHQSLSYRDASLVWFEQFLEQVIKPICVARSDYGLVLLAHQQNILVDFDHGLPCGAKFRDCQGTGFTETAVTRFPLLQENAPEYFMQNENVNSYFSYYLIVNSLNSVIAALQSDLPLLNRSTEDSVVSHEQLIQLSQNLWRKLAQQSFYDRSFYDYLLNSDSLTIKSNFFCFLSAQNETEIADPSKIYVNYPNIFKLAVKKEVKTVFKPLFRQQGIIGKADSGHTNKTGSELVFETTGKQFTVTSCLSLWSFSYDEHGLHTVMDTSTDTLNQAQWFNILEHTFSGMGVNRKTITINQSLWLTMTTAKIPKWAESVGDDVHIQRAAFFQFANIWSQNQANTNVDSPLLLSEQGIEYPQRPPQPQGIWYQQYAYDLDRVISFKCADISLDVATFSHWHNRPEVNRMWELAGTKSEHQQYLEKQTADPHSMAVIGYVDGVAFGYLEVYWTPEDRLGIYYDCQHYDRGVHMLVGNPLFLGGRYFVNWASCLQHAIYTDEQRTGNVLGEPRADNKHVATIASKVGLQKLKEFDFPHKRAALLCSERNDFFERII